MDEEEFRKRGYEMVDYIVKYLELLPQRRVTPDVDSGYLISALPQSAPNVGESVEKIMEDFQQYILPGLTHWQHPGFHGYFPACSSFPSTLAIMLSDVIGYAAFDWASFHGGEIDTLMLNWYGNLIGLPKCFLNVEGSNGAGIMFRSTTECIFMSMLTARLKFLNKLSNRNPALPKAALLCSLMAYCTKGSHSRLEKIALVTLVNVKVLDTGKYNYLRGELLDKAITEDKKMGLIPFFVHIKIGCNVCGGSDSVKEIGLICEKHRVWLHVDASYAGNAPICPEYRYLLDGIEKASSYQSSPSHWMLTSLDCSVMFVKDRFKLANAIKADRSIKGYTYEERDWGYPVNSECRSLKLFFVMKNYGVERLQNHIRRHICLANMFADYVRKDDRFELLGCHFGFSSFRLKGSDSLNAFLKDSINDFGKLYVTPTFVDGKYAIRFIVCAERTSEDDIKFAWDEVCKHAGKSLTCSISDINLQRSLSNDLYDEFYKYALP